MVNTVRKDRLLESPHSVHSGHSVVKIPILKPGTTKRAPPSSFISVSGLYLCNLWLTRFERIGCWNLPTLCIPCTLSSLHKPWSRREELNAPSAEDYSAALTLSYTGVKRTLGKCISSDCVNTESSQPPSTLSGSFQEEACNHPDPLNHRLHGAHRIRSFKPTNLF